MTTIAPDAEKLRELDEEICRAWKAYHEQVHALSGDAYEQAEKESWTILQNELRRLKRRRKLLMVPAGMQT